MNKLSNIEAGLKKSVAYKKSVYAILPYSNLWLTAYTSLRRLRKITNLMVKHLTRVQNPVNTTCYFGAGTSPRKRHDVKKVEKKEIGRKESCKDPKNYDLLCNLNQTYHCVKCVQVRSFFWSVFSGIWTEYGEMRSFGLVGNCFGWFQMVSGVFWIVLGDFWFIADGFGWFQMVCCFSSYHCESSRKINLFLKKRHMMYSMNYIVFYKVIWISQ